MKNKIKFLIIMLLVIVLTVNTISLADSNAKVIAEVSKTSVKSGDTFDISISQEISEGPTGFNFKINYDDEIFELSDEYTVSNPWSILESNEISAGTLELGILYNGAPGNIPTSGKVVKLNFKVKDNYTTTKETTITIEPGWDNGNAHKDGYIELSAIEKTFSVNEKVSENINTSNDTNTNTSNNTSNDTNTNTSNNTSNDTNTNTSNNTSNNTNTNTSNNTSNNTNTNTSNNTRNNTSNNTSNSTSNNTSNTASNLPKTGSRTAYVLFITVGLAGVAFASYKGYQKYKDI